jgi:tRNA A-37 threonylcarbamoyl transferase component Bud32
MQLHTLPFSERDIQPTSDSRVLEISDVVRVVPNKRWVCRGTWDGREVYAKIFCGQDAMRYALRDKSGAEALDRAQIKTPALLLFSELKIPGNYVLIYSAIDSSKNAEQVWHTLNDESRYRLAQGLVSTVAQHHQTGLLQTDLYLKNFLVQGDTIYSIDGDGIRCLSQVSAKWQKLKNLAALFSNMDVLDNHWVVELYEQYCSQLGIPKSQVNKIASLTEKIRHQVERAYAEKKVFRNCTDVMVMKSFRRFEAVSSQSAITSKDMLSLDTFLTDFQHNLKNGNTCTVGKAVIANQQVIIKRYNIKSFWHGLERAFRPTRAAKSWANAYRLIISNIATAKPLALVEERFGCLRRRAYYLSEYVDAPDAQQFFAQSTSYDEKNVAAHNLAKLFYKLYLLKFSHGDFKATNVKLVNLVPVLIDLDSMQAHFGHWFSDWHFERAHIRDLKRFMENWSNNGEITSLLKQAILREYGANPSLVGILIRAGIA